MQGRTAEQAEGGGASYRSASNDRTDLRQGVAVEYVSCKPTKSARELFGEDCDPVEEEQ